MPSVNLPEFQFFTVDRPSTVVRDSLPPPLVTAVEATVSSGKAVQIDASKWEARVSNALYRRVLALNREPGYRYLVHGRRDNGQLFFWATTRVKRPKSKPRRA